MDQNLELFLPRSAGSSTHQIRSLTSIRTVPPCPGWRRPIPTCRKRRLPWSVPSGPERWARLRLEWTIELLKSWPLTCFPSRFCIFRTTGGTPPSTWKPVSSSQPSWVDLRIQKNRFCLQGGGDWVWDGLYSGPMSQRVGSVKDWGSNVSEQPLLFGEEGFGFLGETKFTLWLVQKSISISQRFSRIAERWTSTASPRPGLWDLFG